MDCLLWTVTHHMAFKNAGTQNYSLLARWARRARRRAPPLVVVHESWVRPTAAETPAGASAVESGTYWRYWRGWRWLRSTVGYIHVSFFLVSLFAAHPAIVPVLAATAHKTSMHIEDTSTEVDEEENPLLRQYLEDAEDETMPLFSLILMKRLCFGYQRYACTAMLTACMTKMRGKRLSILGSLLAPGFFIGVAVVSEFFLRFSAGRYLQWRAATIQRRALLTDVESDFTYAVPPPLRHERRIDPFFPDPQGPLNDGRLFVVKASFGVTPIWFRRLRGRGWFWTTDLRHWQSVQHHRCTGGMSEGLLLVPSNRWLLQRLHLRDVRDRVRSPRAAHAPPPLSLPDNLDDAPAEFLCPIAHVVMTDPVIGPAGVSYERSALKQWLRQRKTDPSTQGELEMEDVYVNLNLRSMIAAWAQAQGERQADGMGGGTSETMRAVPIMWHAGQVAQAPTTTRKKPRRRPRVTVSERSSWDAID